LPVADALAELSRVDDGAPFEAALEAAPAFVRPDLARLLPRLAEGEAGAAGAAEEWQRERLFAAVAELLGGVARRSQLRLLIEDVHWADAATLDFLTYLARAVRGTAVQAVVTCRSDEVPLDAAVAEPDGSHTTSVGSRCESDSPDASTEPRQGPVIRQ
jgi:hypothetical protein